MGFAGTYKAIKVTKYNEEKGFIFEDIEKALAETTDQEDKRIYEQISRSLLIVDDDANIQQAMEIPEGTPADEIEKAKKHGMIISDDGKYLITKADPGKIENNELYLYDKSTFIAGTEWVKISTEVEGELKLVTTIYKRI